MTAPERGTAAIEPQPGRRAGMLARAFAAAGSRALHRPERSAANAPAVVEAVDPGEAGIDPLARR